MSKLTRSDLYRILAHPLAKKVNQKVVEKWSETLWGLVPQKPKPGEPREPFVMMFPPPNITGNLHLGHALTGAIQDALIRHRRMQGKDCVFIPGFDHAGLATQIIVERLLWKQKGITRVELGRNKFVQLAQDWKTKKVTEMRTQIERLGLDLDHQREYFTMDENSSFAVHAAFKQLFNSGLIYRSIKPIFWCESLQTTLSDIEVEQVEGKHRYVRTGEIVEKRPQSQWFINAQAMAKRAVEVVNDNEIEMIPKNYKRSWSAWLLENGVQDWCISRQSWWGHRIPAYKLALSTDIGENWIVADSLEEAQSKLGENVSQDPDVLDTWFSSSLLPLTVSGWPDTETFEANCRSQNFPLHLMETGFDILTYWVSKMTMISLALTGRVPFKLVLLHGMICDSDGKKMSKSLGNVIDPLDVIDGASLDELQDRTKQAHSQGILDDRQLQPVLDNQKRLFPKGIPPCGADGLRAYLLSHDVQEEVVRVQIVQIEKIRRLSNKIWNIFRFLFPVMETLKQPLKMDVGALDRFELDSIDQQVLERMSGCISAAHESFLETYQLQHCFNCLESFLMEDLSRDYMVQVRSVLVSCESQVCDKERKLEVFATCLLTSTKLLHPYMPHLSEFLYQKLVMHNGQVDKRHQPPLEVIKTSLLSHESFPRPDEWSKFSGEPSLVS